MQQSSADLKAVFETGDIPEGSNFADFIESYENLVDNNSLVGFESDITAVFPGDIDTAYQLTKKVNQVITSSDTGAGVKLPQALQGRICIVAMASGDSIGVYPTMGDNIFTAGTNNPQSIPYMSIATFTCVENGVWFYSI